MGLFNRKQKMHGSQYIELDETRLANAVEYKSEDCKPDICIIAQQTHYNIIYRDGQHVGTYMSGGALYPFAPDPLKKGSKGQMKKFRGAKIIAIPKAFEVEIKWGSGRQSYCINDPKTGEARYVTAHGEFYVKINPVDSAYNANQFYLQILQNRDLATFKNEELRDFLKGAFLNRIGATIQDYVEKTDMALDPGRKIPPSDMVKMSTEICGMIKDIYAQYGLTINELSSSGSIIQDIHIFDEEPKVKMV